MLNSPGKYIGASYRNPQLDIMHWPVAVILSTFKCIAGQSTDFQL
jgi:hypothetical protein